MRGNSAWRILFLLCACVFTANRAVPCSAQSDSGHIVEGTVRDSSGAVVPNAAVVLRSLANDEVLQRTITDNEGSFRFAAVPPGEYVVRASVLSQREISSDGFEVGSENIDVNLEARVRIEITLHRLVTAAPTVPLTTAPLPPIKPGYSIVKVFYATDRRSTGKAEPKKAYSSDRARDEKLSFGTCEVSIPTDHQMGHLEQPHWWKFEFRDDPEKHVALLNVRPVDKGNFLRELSERVSQSETREAFVFIHGYKVTFEDAARRTAQLAYDLGFNGAPILYSWPSKGKLSGYLADEATVDWTAPHLKKFLVEIAEKSQATTIHLIAHSMGNRPLATALNSMTDAGSRVLPMFRQVILTAPDIDAGVFRQLGQAIQKTATRVTLYASSGDEALKASQKLHAFPRAGESGTNIVVVRGIDTIDASLVDTGLLGHSYYGENRSVISDMFYLLKEGKPPHQRPGLRRMQLASEVYWAFQH